MPKEVKSCLEVHLIASLFLELRPQFPAGRYQACSLGPGHHSAGTCMSAELGFQTSPCCHGNCLVNEWRPSLLQLMGLDC